MGFDLLNNKDAFSGFVVFWWVLVHDRTPTERLNHSNHGEFKANFKFKEIAVFPKQRSPYPEGYFGLPMHLFSVILLEHSLRPFLDLKINFQKFH